MQSFYGGGVMKFSTNPKLFRFMAGTVGIKKRKDVDEVVKREKMRCHLLYFP